MGGPVQTEFPRAKGATGAPGDLLDTPQAGPAAIRGSLVRAIGYVGSAVVSLLSVSILIRHIGIPDFGHYVTVLSLVTLSATVSDAGLTTLAIREYTVRGQAERDRLMANILGLRLVLTAAGVLGAILFALVAGYESRLVIGTAIAGAGILLVVLQGTFAVPLTSMLRLGTVTALDFARQVLSTAAIVTLVVAGGTLLGFLALPIPIGMAILLVTRWLVRGEMAMAPRVDIGEWRDLLRPAVPIAAAVTVAAIYFRVTIIVMSLVASAQQTGYYATAYRVLEVIVLLPGLIVGAAFPVLARAARDDLKRLTYAIQRLSEAMLIVGGWFALSTVLGADFAVRVLAGGTSDASIPVLQIQGIAIGAIFIATPWNFGLLSLGRFAAVMRITLVGLVVVLTLTLVLVPRLNAQGAAIAIVVGDTTQTVLGFLVLRRSQARIPFPTVAWLRVMLAAGLGMLTLLAPGLDSLERALIGTAVYFATIVALRGIPEELKHALGGRAAR